MRLPLNFALAVAASLASAGQRITRRVAHAINYAPERETGRRVRWSYRRGEHFPGIIAHHTGYARSRRAFQQCRRIRNAMRTRKAANV